MKPSGELLASADAVFVVREVAKNRSFECHRVYYHLLIFLLCRFHYFRYFEDQLKQRYETFIEALQAITHDSIVAPKKKALSAIFDMLAGKPEQEQQLLTVIINKLGDPETKVATLGAHLLGKLGE